ncbi:gamma-aminobutyric acid type B receptor subunit 1-like [Ruditapes philippinarum]|uniref:gamma-aminobutyric acid type B receptor subunit 1-like n=1 Tax=Ruditapes philippinarum TaxID=129788 RepID=UPI00295B2885|nr:gamma-aminobutyric acid type B receptor subunit 1-like [Ruditapes philippinarum]
MAVDDINANELVLQNYNLTYNWFDSKCHAGLSVFRMSERLSKDLPYTMVLGAGCSVASESTAQVSYLWNLTQLSFASTSPALSDRKRYPRFFRIGIPDQKLNPSKLSLMREFDWKKVATINQAREFFSAVIDDFVKNTINTDITILSQEIFVTNPYNRLLNLKKQDARIIITAMYEDKAREMICAAYKIGFYGPKIVWIFNGWYTPTFWKINLETVDCTEVEMSLVVEGAFLTSSVYSNPIEERGIANLTVSEFFKLYREHPTYTSSLEDNVFLTPWCYDHVWAAALALNCTDATLVSSGHSKTLDLFTYTDSDISDMIFSCMTRTSLTGVSGRVVFSTGADPDRLVKVERIQDGARIKIALYRQDKNPQYFEWNAGALKWKGTYVESLR